MRRGFLLATLVVLLVGVQPAHAQNQPPLPALPQSAEIELKLQRDGALSVAEAISVPKGPGMTRRIPLRTPAVGNRDRVLTVHDVSIEGDGEVEQSDDALTVRLGGGSTSITRYTVDGTVSESGGRPQVSWQLEGGWDTQLNLIRATFAAPKIADAVRCVVGADRDCLSAQTDHLGLTRFSHQNLLPGEHIDIGVELPAGTVRANERLEPSDTLAGAFVLTVPVGWSWLGFAVALCAGGALLLWARRGDAGPLPVETLAEDGQFASPDSALPGHLGIVLSGRMDTVDLAATVLDLAVRNYLSVSEIPGDPPDWVLTRCNEPDGQLTEFERMVFDQLFTSDTKTTLSELRATRIDIRAALYEDVVRRRWFRRRDRLVRAGVRIIFYGVFLTVLLALTVGYAQLGVILSAAGAALALGARLLPAHTERGRTLRRRLLGLLDQIRDAEGAGPVQGAGNSTVFSRGLPYALALGEARSWLVAFGEPKAYWYSGESGGLNEFVVSLVGALAGASPSRALCP